MKGQIKLVIPEWIYDEDTGTVMCKCPECECRMVLGYYQYHNPYNFCPYCGEKLDAADDKLKSKRKEVYGHA